jgi:hypothetical protein
VAAFALVVDAIVIVVVVVAVLTVGVGAAPDFGKMVGVPLSALA